MASNYAQTKFVYPVIMAVSTEYLWRKVADALLTIFLFYSALEGPSGVLLTRALLTTDSINKVFVSA